MDNVAYAKYLFNVGLRHAHSVLFSSGRNKAKFWFWFIFWLNTFEEKFFKIKTDNRSSNTIEIDIGPFAQHWIGKLLIPGWLKRFS